MSGRRFVDTNVLIYSVSTALDERAKRDRAREILDGDCALSVQVLQEFYVQATRATRRGRLDHDQAVEFLTAWLRFPVQDVTTTISRAALRIAATHRISYWDAAVVAAAGAQGCAELMSEDLNDGQRIEDVTIVNPFR